ncbi:nitrate- and nitrite sensing domain-containing protein, partial [Spirillospora sp. NPDC049652]
ESEVDSAAAAARRAAVDLRGQGSAGLRLTVGNVVNRLEGLRPLRKLAEKLDSGAIIDKYSDFIGAFNGFHQLVSQQSQSPDLAKEAQALGALANAKDAASKERALLGSALWNRSFEPNDLQSFQNAHAELETALDEFRNSATSGQLRLYDDTVTGPELDRAELLRLQALAAVQRSAKLSTRPLNSKDAATWVTNSGARMDRMRSVEASIADDLTAHADKARDDATTAAIRDGSLMVIVLAAVLGLLIVMARSLVRPLRRLKDGALEIAGTRLPGLVDRLRDPEAAAQGIEVEPINVSSTDEIGQVARAFDEVHREAVRLAADEAVLRGNINAMFVNLSRRSQTLIERQLQLIEELEQSERDEEQLANLFRLDHLATRMRRNNENLLVLGGQDQARRWNQPVPFIDVVRASLSEVEQYERVEVRVHGDMTVAGPVVNDLVHLLAELVENATVFSDGRTRVTVSGQRLSGGGAMLQITDNGVGMTPDELEQANWRLANPPVIDFSAARRMGLFVVGRLAIRHGIRVELRAAQGGGLTAFVMLPDHVVSPVDNASVGTRGGGTAQLEGAPVPALAAPTATLVEDRPGAGYDDPNGSRPGADGPRFGDNGTRFDGRPGLRRGDTGPMPAFDDQRDTGAGHGVDDRAETRTGPRGGNRFDGYADGPAARPAAPRSEPDDPN